MTTGRDHRVREESLVMYRVSDMEKSYNFQYCT